MQYLIISEQDTLLSISRIVGQQNIDLILAENGLTRTPKIGAQYYKKCRDLLAENPPEVSGARKSALLNSLTGSEEVFEKACLLDEDGWKIFSAFQSFPDALRVPESIKLPYSTRVIGDIGKDNISAVIGNAKGGIQKVYTATGGSLGARRDDAVSSATYKTVMKELKQSSSINPAVFNSVNTSFPVSVSRSRTSTSKSRTPQYTFNLPWGKIQLYSTLLDERIDIPAYPEEVEKQRSASYTAMPDIIYQYEPWIVYQSSGPREQQLSFHLHRDMWSGNHLDGKANQLIRFCDANTFPRYSGSSVNSPTVRVYIDGEQLISGVLTQTKTRWSGPIGRDGWYLEFELLLNIQEVSTVPLNIDTVRNFKLIGS